MYRTSANPNSANTDQYDGRESDGQNNGRYTIIWIITIIRLRQIVQFATSLESQPWFSIIYKHVIV